MLFYMKYCQYIVVAHKPNLLDPDSASDENHTNSSILESLTKPQASWYEKISNLWITYQSLVILPFKQPGCLSEVPS